MFSVEKKGIYITILAAAFSIVIFFVNILHNNEPSKIDNKINSHQFEFNYYTNEIYHQFYILKEKALIHKLKYKIKNLENNTPINVLEFMNFYKDYIHIIKEIQRNSHNLVDLGVRFTDELLPMLTKINIYKSDFNEKDQKLIESLIKNFSKVTEKGEEFRDNMKKINLMMSSLDESYDKYIKENNQGKKKYKDIDKVRLSEVKNEIKLMMTIAPIMFKEEYGLLNPDKLVFSNVRDIGIYTDKILTNYNKFIEIQHNYVTRKDNEFFLDNLVIFFFFFFLLVWILFQKKDNTKEESNTFKVVIQEVK